MSCESTLTPEMREYGEMLLWRWDEKNEEKREDLRTTKHGVLQATVNLFPEASDAQIGEMVSMAGHGLVTEAEIQQHRE